MQNNRMKNVEVVHRRLPQPAEKLKRNHRHHDGGKPCTRGLVREHEVQDLFREETRRYASRVSL